MRQVSSSTLRPWGMAVLLAISVATGRPVVAADRAASDWSETEYSQVRLVSASETTGGQARLRLGLHFRLRKGWKIYWRSPGDAGFPPLPDWSESKNLRSATLSWPAPERFSVLDLETLGYKDEVVLPLAAVLEDPNRDLGLRGTVRYLACDEICIPHEARLRLTIPPGPAEPSPFAHLINRFAALVPGEGTAHGLSIVDAVLLGPDPLTPTDGAAAPALLRVTAASTVPLVAADLYVEGPQVLAFSKPVLRLADGGTEAVLEVKVWGLEDLESSASEIPLTLTLVDGQRAAEVSIRVEWAESGDRIGYPEASHSLSVILLLALLGGLVLNLMPCVLPVLSIKLVGLVGHGGGERRAVRVGFIASAAGIVFSFLVLASALVFIKSLGMTVGWGIQFQYPWFLIAMTLVVTVFACNLWGFFEVRLPDRIAILGRRADGHGEPSGSLPGHFLTGAFAALLATPCSAPFLGTAVGFALARGPAEIYAIFTALGIGLALPYLGVAAAPGLATRLPRPGPWMVLLRRILGVALAGTGIWLVSVLANPIGASGALAVGLLTAGVGGTLYLRHRMPERHGPSASAATAVFALIALLVPGMAEVEPSTPPRDTVVASLWRPFDEAAIPGLVAAGKIVLVDVTADWCLTCRFNKSVVLERGDVLRALSGGAVVSMQADWTRPDEGIARYLAGFGRYGVPFNAVYGPDAPDGLPLPELLTRELVLSAFERAGPVDATPAP